jgi:hypothetical protein
MPLGDMHFGKREVSADQAGLQANGFLEEARALVQPLLLKSNGAEHRVGGTAGVRIRERQFGVLFGLVQPALSYQQRSLLERITAGARCPGGRGRLLAALDSASVRA